MEWHVILEQIPKKGTERWALWAAKYYPFPVTCLIFYFHSVEPIIEVWSKKVERILSKAISLEFLYNDRMAKRIKGFTHICSQNIHQFLSVHS